MIGSREEEPAGPTDRTAIAASFRHDVDTRLQELQSLCRIEIGAQTHGISDEGIDTEWMILAHDLVLITAAGREIT